MKRNIESLLGFSMAATDGDIGTVKDFYFDDDRWMVRYLVIETGNWLNGRKVLISPDAHLVPDWENETFPIKLSKEQIENSPDIDTQLPVYRQQEVKLYEHYALGNYWRAGFVAGGVPLPMNEVMIKADEQIANERTDDDLHLRSIEKVLGYEIKATDGTVGTIKDFIINDVNWNIEFIVVDTSKWFSGKNVIISPQIVNEINWDISEVTVNINVEQVKDSPEYDKSELWRI